MGLFNFESAETRVRNRSSIVKGLAQKLKAQYQYGIRGIKEKFDIGSSENSNVIVGEIKGFEYCFTEHYHSKSGKNDHSRWISEVSLRLNDEFPDFELSTKSSALTGAGCMMVLGLPFLGVPIFMTLQALLFIIFSFMDKSGTGLVALFPLIFFIGFACIFGAIGWFIFSSGLKTFRQVNNQGKYYIRNPKFKEKYVILSDADVYRVRKVFTDKVCSKLVNFRPEIQKINCTKNCLKAEFGSNEQLSYPLCSKYLGPLVKQAEIIEDYDYGDGYSNDFGDGSNSNSFL